MQDVQTWSATTAAAMGRKKQPIFVWVFFGVQGVFFLWFIAAVTRVLTASNQCGVGAFSDACRDGAALGLGIGLTMILNWWMAVDVIMGISYAIHRFRPGVTAVVGSRDTADPGVVRSLGIGPSDAWTKQALVALLVVLLIVIAVLTTLYLVG